MLQNTDNPNHDFSQSQPIDSGMELLKKVIQSNEQNIQELRNLQLTHQSSQDYFQNASQSIRNTCDALRQAIKFIDSQYLDIKELREIIPKNIDANLSEESVSRLKIFEEKIESFRDDTTITRQLNTGSMVMMLVTVLTITLTFYFSRQWYNTSIQTKTEVRQELLQELEKDRKAIYGKSQVEQLRHNTEIIKKWMKKNPKDAENFLKFKDGYEAR